MAGPSRGRALRPGDAIAIAAPAGPVDPARLETGEAWLRDQGFDVRRRDDLTDRRGYLAGSDERRAAEWMEWIEDERVAAIVCARGGYGCHRIVGRLDAGAVARAGKPVVGYSDVTTLLLWQWRTAGLPGIHGPMLERIDRLSDASLDALARGLRGELLPVLEGRGVVGGRAEGRLVGGSLSLVAASLGTPWEIETAGSILMLEEVGEQPYRVDRMLRQLDHAGRLRDLAGVGLGQMVGCEGTRYPVPTVDEVLREMFEPLGVPLVMDLPFGHSDHHLPWVVGGRAVIDGDRGTVEMLEPAAD